MLHTTPSLTTWQLRCYHGGLWAKVWYLLPVSWLRAYVSEHNIQHGYASFTMLDLL